MSGWMMKAEKRIQAWMHGALMLEVTLGEAPPGGEGRTCGLTEIQNRTGQ